MRLQVAESVLVLVSLVAATTLSTTQAFVLPNPASCSGTALSMANGEKRQKLRSFVSRKILRRDPSTSSGSTMPSLVQENDKATDEQVKVEVKQPELIEALTEATTPSTSITVASSGGENPSQKLLTGKWQIVPRRTQDYSLLDALAELDIEVSTTTASTTTTSTHTAKSTSTTTSTSSSDVTSQIDDLFTTGKPQQALDLIQSNPDYEKDAELYWRYVKAHYELFATSQDKAAQEDYLRKGIDAATKGLDATQFPNNGYLLKWKAILLGKLGSFQPTKEKMQNSFLIQSSLQKAQQQLPEDASIRQALGEWCFKVAGISFVERQVASVLFGQPPQSTYAQALDYFQQAFELKPTLVAATKIAETYAKMGQNDDAKTWQQTAESLSSSSSSSSN
ncbi:Regulator of microtubule dynamics protein [Seminavis robusta]|uniref:Regulator of microtubule dynamics protein 1 n=1 Tax=Seminavis robusta TaxID=568900 RepID=A0A9N8H7V5_9STRA|nr:Regulator of microtubule dynamics protein [Seminavis robusta]|eukprot:Sro76_g041660.1 Regulator of microtubule dynamics protein (394) ;mRNA; f:65003-66184